MSNLFGKRWVTIVSILFICAVAYSLAAPVGYAQTCYMCTDNTWQADCTARGGRKTMDICSPGYQPYYTLRAGYTCGADCSNSTSTCNVSNFQLCNNVSGTNKKTMCGMTSDPCVPASPYSCVYLHGSDESAWVDCTSPNTCSCDNWDDTNDRPWNWTNQCTCASPGAYGQ
jgi:hypothetical protein